MDNAEALIAAARIHQAVKDPGVAHLVIGLNKVVSSHLIPGLSVETAEKADGVEVRVSVAEGSQLEKPVHMCFGLLQEAGVQKIGMEIEVGAGAAISVIAHCVFPNAVKVRHIMDAHIHVGEGGSYAYFERHIHGATGGVEIYPTAEIELDDGARFKTEFELIEGRAGLIDMKYETQCDDNAVMEMTARISGSGDDIIRISEIGHLNGARSRGVLKTRVAVSGRARADVYNRLTADGDHATGHVDCKEIVLDEAVASATPVVEVNNPKAHVTHEAAIGSVDNKQLETLMARGLDEDAAAEVIIRGLLS